MPEPTTYKFTYQEIAELMARQIGLKDGLWGIQVRFGIGAANVGASPEELVPAAIVPVLEIGLQKFEQPSRLTIDASKLAETGPRVRRARRGGASRASRSTSGRPGNPGTQ